MKKDAITNTIVLIWLAVICIATMVFGATAESWSQNHTYNFDFLLYGCLGSIVTIFIIRSFTYSYSHWTLLKIGSMKVRERHMNRIVAYMFFGVLCFGVNSDEKIVETLHLIYTGLGIAFANLNMVLAQKYVAHRVVAITGSIFGVTLFLWSFFGEALTIAEGEALAALPIIIWIYITTKKEK